MQQNSSDMENSINEEWIVTNALGGYASSTVIGQNTRCYHGLLVAALEPPTNRQVLVAKIEERLFFDSICFELSTNQYPGVRHPNGAQFLEHFQPAPYPLWNYKTADWHLEKSIFMVQNSNTTLVNYTNKSSKALVLELHPLYTSTDFHHTFHQKSEFDFYSEINSNSLKTHPQQGKTPIFTQWTAGEFIEENAWFKNIQLPLEKSRGLEDQTDYYQIGYVKYELQPNESLALLFSIDQSPENSDINLLISTEKERLATHNALVTNTFYKDLLQSGSQFIVNRKSTQGASIIAGYHWFSDWGRDTMIAMRGLTIATGNKMVSESILNTFFKYINQGMIPNRFPDNCEDKIEYNTIDASLWLFITVYDFYTKFQDLDFIKNHIEALKEVLDWHINGTRYDIHVTPEGFLYGGQEGVQLTWMDAIVHGKVITPRMGCPVEINALWYNALRIYAEFCRVLNIEFEHKYADTLSRFEYNFHNFFVNEQGTLHDVIIPNGPTDASFRSNQIYCLSLPFTLLNQDHQKHIFEAIKSKLFTPYGLRTLEKDHPEFEKIYQGNQWNRDHAYHQGTVWTYIIYEYYEAFFKLYGATEENKRTVIAELLPLKNHFYNHQGLHCISEVFDGDNPQEGKGTIQQAWSVSALIQLYTQYKLYEL